MNFLEANKVLSNFSGGESLSLHLATSSNIEPLLIYLRAEFAKRDIKIDITTLPFGTLGQTLATTTITNRREVLLLLPWDLLPECDWRSGIPVDLSEPDVLLEYALGRFDQIKKRKSEIIYLPASIPPLYLNTTKCTFLAANLTSMAAELNANFLDSSYFSLPSYLASGVPISGVSMGPLAKIISNVMTENHPSSAKVLVTDLDNVLWAGLIAEDGIDGIQCNSEGAGYHHYIYQSLLAKLKASGVLIAAVSRNDIDIALSPIKTGKILLSENDFLDVLASYEPKSVHIRRLAKTYNLGLDTFVFVDDNPIEIAEVNSALPEVRCIQFPKQVEDYSKFLDALSLNFQRSIVSKEDKQRTEMYQLRRKTNVERSNFEESGGDLTRFLTDLCMELTIYNSSKSNVERAIQLINKTNQFNLNGKRVTSTEVTGNLAAGGNLYTVALKDRSGNHGDILVCLIDANGLIISLVMSCRVFQRNIEHAFIFWLLNKYENDIKLSYIATDKNTPIHDFLNQPAFEIKDDLKLIEKDKFISEYELRFNMFQIEEVGFD